MRVDPARHLHVVDAETGEKLDECPGCRERDDVVAGLQRDLHGWMHRYRELRRNLEREARESPLWPQAVELFEEWKRECRHPKARWTADRFWLVAPLLTNYGLDLCRRAIAGAKFDPFVTTRRNGSKQRHDGWELIFRNAGKVEEFSNRAPRGWAP